MKRYSLLLITILFSYVMVISQTDAFIKLNDLEGRHPRITNITVPGDADILEVYNSIYGHGAIIENPWVAYRIYLDNRQSLDLYVKGTPRLELDVTGFYTTPEQMDEGYGCDVLWAGKSIAAGSFRGWRNNQPVTIDTVAYRTQSVVDDATVEVKDTDWIFNGHPVQMTQTYSVKPDSRELFVIIKLEGYEPGDLFATGIQKLETGNKGIILKEGRAASWGSNIPDKTHTELIEQVGLGIIVNPDNLVKTVEDELNYIFVVKPDANGEISYMVISAGDREINGFKNSDIWFDHIKSINNIF